MLNDIIKISDIKICYASPNLNKEKLNIVIFTLFGNYENLNITFYIQPIYAQNHYVI